MDAQTRAILMSALICPGVGQLTIGRRRGWIFIIMIIFLLIWLMKNIAVIVFHELPPELVYNLSPIEYAAAFVRIRHRVYLENIPTMLGIGAVWAGSIIDLAIWKKPAPEKPAHNKSV